MTLSSLGHCFLQSTPKQTSYHEVRQGVGFKDIKYSTVPAQMQFGKCEQMSGSSLLTGSGINSLTFIRAAAHTQTVIMDYPMLIKFTPLFTSWLLTHIANHWPQLISDG